MLVGWLFGSLLFWSKTLSKTTCKKAVFSWGPIRTKAFLYNVVSELRKESGFRHRPADHDTDHPSTHKHIEEQNAHEE